MVAYTIALCRVQDVWWSALTIAYTITAVVVKGLIPTTSGVSIALAPAFFAVENLIRWARMITGTFTLTRIGVEFLW